ncbi:MAG: CPBP family intramembrane metalloprotease [Cytophagales bacterium]|nr:MAG: CPBP family intramembrane metalloprotease [Cytophagales bacterium]TAF62247.1 MAG: CPBP family intramembrane metalloprotease [Cytophagales bacterium]
MTNRQLSIYCGIVFFISWTIQILTLLITNDLNSFNAKLGLATTMVSPLFVTLGFIIADKSLRGKIVWKPNKHIFTTSFLAVIIPTITAFVVLFIMQNMHYGQSGWFMFSTTEVTISGGPFLLGLGKQSWLFFMSNILVTGVAYSLFTGTIAVGEEFAWRGFLQGVLIEKFGIIKGVAILGFLWSLWHLPIQLAGYNYPENQLIGSFIISPIMLISVSLFYAWLTLKSGSFIPAAIAHGAFNTIEEGIISNINLEVPMLYVTLVKLFVTVATGLLFMYLINRKQNLSQVNIQTRNDT